MPNLDSATADIDAGSATRVRITKSLLWWGVVAMLTAALVIVGARVAIQQYSVLQIKRLQGRVHYSGEVDSRGEPIPSAQPHGPELLRKFIGNDFFDVPAAVHMSYPTGPGVAGHLFMRDVGRLRSLRYFSAGGHGPLSDEDLQQLSEMRELRSLSLYAAIRHDSDLAMLKGLSLEWLSLHRTHISDKGLESLQYMTSLKTLDLTRTRVTDQGLRFLEGLPNLRSLVLRRTKVTPAGCAQFRLKCPHCVVQWESLTPRPTVPIKLAR